MGPSTSRQQRGYRRYWRVRGHFDAMTREVFETNTFGVMAMTQAVFRNSALGAPGWS